MQCSNVNEPIIGDFSLRQIETIFKQIKKYHPSGGLVLGSLGSYQYPDERLANVFYILTGDNEGFPMEDRIIVGKRPNRGSKESVWELMIGYDETSGDDFDYERPAVRRARDDNRIFTRGQPHETRFALKHYWIRQASDQLCADLEGIHQLLSHLDRSTSSIGAWAESGLGAAIACRSCVRAIAYKANTWLREHSEAGISLPPLQERLRCSNCGKKKVTLYPYPSRD